MNALEEFLHEPWLSQEKNTRKQTEAMNLLQNRGIISDNCIAAADVAPADCDRAIRFLKTEHQKPLL